MKNAYEQLTDHFRKVGDLDHVYSIASWDEAAMMPEGGGAARGHAMATLGVVIHEMQSSEKMASGWTPVPISIWMIGSRPISAR